MTTQENDPRPARTFGRFQILRTLGEGGGGVVLEALDPSLKRRVALKLLRSGATAGFVVSERLKREARALAKVHHPHVVNVYETGTIEGKPYVVMELVQGKTLEQLMKEGAPRERLLELLEQAALGVQAAHEAGLVHRDLKPSNILVDAVGARVVDFGIARLDDASVKLSQTGAFMGTAAYMAPEQAMGVPENIGPWTDVYSLGATLYEMLTGTVPHANAANIMALMVELSSGSAPDRPSALAPGIPAELEAVCLKALAKERHQRYGTARELAAALRTVRTSVAPAKRARARGLALAVALGVLAAGGAAALLSRRSSGVSSLEPAAPPWWSELDAALRPPLPLPPGVVFGEGAGEYRNVKDGSVLVYVPAGDALVGSADPPASGREAESPRHEVTLAAYFVGKSPVTVGQYDAFVTATRHAPRRRADPAFAAPPPPPPANPWREPLAHHVPDAALMPVVNVSWHDARAYALWAGLRLPSEAEWEKAASWDPRGHRCRRFPWGDEPVLRRECANLEHGERSALARVGCFPQGASPCGALDMLGNVSQLCADALDPAAYRTLPRQDPLRAFDATTDPRVVVRGASFRDRVEDARTTRRDSLGPDETSDRVGFRVACSAAAPPAPARAARLPELEVLDLACVPATPGVGESAVFRITVANHGDVALPRGAELAVAVFVDAHQKTWVSTTSGMGAHERVVLEAKSPAWSPPAPGVYGVMVHAEVSGGGVDFARGGWLARPLLLLVGRSRTSATDVPDELLDAMNYLAIKGAMTGYADDTFRPNRATTIRQVTKVVVVAEGFPLVPEPGPGAPSSFTDVGPTDQFYRVVETALAQGLLERKPPFVLGNDEQTREDMVRMIVRARGYELVNPLEPAFDDVPRTARCYRFVETAWAHGLIAREDDRTFRPLDLATRGELALMLYRALTVPSVTTAAPAPR